VRNVPKKLEVNYDRNIYTQLEETLEKVEKLSAEMNELKKSHRREMYLQNEKHEKAIKSLKAGQSTEIRELKGIIKSQASEISKLKEENTSLREIISKNSGNSSKPPSSDGFKKIYVLRGRNLGCASFVLEKEIPAGHERIRGVYLQTNQTAHLQ
jgi:TolA-binding protein